MKHKHAELMMQYAQDAMESSEPWRNWEAYNTHDSKWNDCSNHPKWYEGIKYRRKPKMVSVTLMDGEVVSWPEPHRTALEYGDNYYYVDVSGWAVSCERWYRLEWDNWVLSNGWIHLTEEAAEQHSYALFKINNQVAK